MKAIMWKTSKHLGQGVQEWINKTCGRNNGLPRQTISLQIF